MEDLQDLDHIPRACDPAAVPREHEELASEIVQETGGDHPQMPITALLTLAQLSYQVFRYCRQERLRRALRRASDRPHGLAALRIRHWVTERMPPETDMDALMPAVYKKGGEVAGDDERFELLRRRACRG